MINQDDLLGFVKHYQVDPLVKDYGECLKDADYLVFIFPIWWGIMPAMTKGFIEKVFTPETFHGYNEDEIMPPTVNTEMKIIVISIKNTPKDRYESFANNAIEGALINGTLKTIGFKNVNWVSLNQVKQVC